MEIGTKIRHLRQLKGFSQEQMAEKLGMSPNGYAKIERGESDPSHTRLEQIAKALEVSLLELLSTGERHFYYIQQNNGTQSHHISTGFVINGSISERESEILKMLDSLRKEVESLREENQRLRHIVSTYENK